MKLGLIGGIGPESTIKYYRLIIEQYQREISTKSYPEILIESIDMKAMLDLVFKKEFEKLVDFLSQKIFFLERAGADFIAMASNTPHVVFDELEEKTQVPLISIVDETLKVILEKRIKKVGLFGTKSTMTSGFYQNSAKKYNIEIIVPEDIILDFVHEKYMNELVFNVIKESTKKQLIEIAQGIKNKYSIEGLILGGTELSLILEQSDFKDLLIFDTTKIHVNSLVKQITEVI